MTSSIKFGRDAVAWGSFEDNTIQTISSTTTAYPVEINTQLDGFACDVQNNDAGEPTKVYVYRNGVYNIQFSLQLANVGGQLQDADVWLTKNGQIVPNTNTSVTVPYSHAGLPGKAVAAWNFALRMDAGDYFELYWCATSTQVSMPTIPAKTSPTRPVTPSVILSVVEV